MSEEGHHLIEAVRDPAGRQRRPVDQDHRKPQRPRRVELGPRSRAAGILGHDDLDVMGAKKRRISGLGERAAGDDDRSLGNGQGMLWRIDQPQKVVMLRLCREGRQILPADRQEDPRRCIRQFRRGGGHVAHMSPVVAGAGGPGRALEGAKRHACGATCGDGIPAHLHRKGMGRIDHMGDILVPQVALKALSPAEAADSCRQGLRHWRLGAAGIGKHGVDSRGGERVGELARLGRAAEKKDAGHG